MFGVWELAQPGQREQKGYEIRMEVEAAGLLGLWASVEYIRMSSGGDDGGRGWESKREVGAMIRPTMMEVENGKEIAVDIRIDPESLAEGDLFFEIEQDGHSIVVTMDCLRELVMAAEQLMLGRKP